MCYNSYISFIHRCVLCRYITMECRIICSISELDWGPEWVGVGFSAVGEFHILCCSVHILTRNSIRACSLSLIDGVTFTTLVERSQRLVSRWKNNLITGGSFVCQERGKSEVETAILLGLYSQVMRMPCHLWCGSDFWSYLFFFLEYCFLTLLMGLLRFALGLLDLTICKKVHLMVYLFAHRKSKVSRTMAFRMKRDVIFFVKIMILCHGLFV